MRLGLAPGAGREANLLIIYGTQGNEEDNKATLEIALMIEKSHKERNISLEIKKDVEVKEEDIKNRHLRIIGNPKCNSLLAKINDKLPIKIEGDSGKGVGVLMAIPNPLNPEKYAIVDMMLSPKDFLSLTRPVACGMADYAFVVMTKKDPILEEGFFIKPDPVNWKVLTKEGNLS